MEIIARNKKAHLEYEILEKFEAGLVLTGEEIKGIRARRVNLDSAFCRVSNNEAWVLNMHISNTQDPERTRKLLLHKEEIKTLTGKTQQKGLTLIALSLYLKKGRAKVEIGLARGKKIHDRREDIRKRDLNRQTQRELSERS